MSHFSFDDSRICWQAVPDIAHLQYSILDIDQDRRIIDVLFKFAAGRRIVLHRHKVLNKTLVIQGEHRLYEADGRLMDVRPAGRYTSSEASDKPHREGGGEQDAVVLFSIRGGDGVLYEILDDAMQCIGELSWRDFIDLYDAQPGVRKEDACGRA
ncbi:regulator [Methylomonas sp. SURF-2]|uniref:Regulator n=1 Tax=Methylomonas subterranea TaxID=2952225 RepID=A0ABT1TBH9_9GAMM|nr:regulator [Methylomonas sp. SURF-2]MCQ8102801.1 regulator [Methylomonas sp. SURF-2]